MLTASFAGRFRHDARFSEPHVPPIGVALIDGDDAAFHLMEVAIRARHADGELGKPIAAIALDMDLDDLDGVTLRTEAKRSA